MTHRFEMRNGVAQIVIYIYTPLDYEFASDDKIIQNNASYTADKIRNYVQDNFSKLSDTPVMLIMDGIILGSLSLNSILKKIRKKIFSSSYFIVQNFHILQFQNNF